MTYATRPRPRAWPGISDTLYALLMSLAFAALWATWFRSVFEVPQVCVEAAATAWVFISDITTALSVSL